MSDVVSEPRRRNPHSSTIGTGDESLSAVAEVQTEGKVTAEGAPSAGDTAATAWLYRCDEPPREVALGELEEALAADETFAWIDLSAYAEEDLRRLAGLLHLHPIGVRVALAGWQRPRLDVFADQYFVAATVVGTEAGSYRIEAGELDLFVGANYLASAHKRPLPFVEAIAERAAQNPQLAPLDSAFMLYIVLDELVADYERLTEGLEDSIEATEEQALREVSDTFLEDLLRLKRYVFALNRLADQHRGLFVAFLRPDFPFVAGDEVLPYYRDLEARLARQLDRMAAAKDDVDGAFDIYVSAVAHRTNRVMKLLTFVSTLLLPLTVILGFFGTNFTGIPMYGTYDFFLMVLVIVILVAVMVTLYHRHGWF
ncbi:MAG TPA: magnesium transporter CorA family protein [Thermomicrobiales bacterium]